MSQCIVFSSISLSRKIWATPNFFDYWFKMGEGHPGLKTSGNSDIFGVLPPESLSLLKKIGFWFYCYSLKNNIRIERTWRWSAKFSWNFLSIGNTEEIMCWRLEICHYFPLIFKYGRTVIHSKRACLLRWLSTSWFMRCYDNFDWLWFLWRIFFWPNCSKLALEYDCTKTRFFHWKKLVFLIKTNFVKIRKSNKLDVECE